MTIEVIEDFNTINDIHFTTTLGRLGRKKFPQSITIKGFGNGYDFERVKIAEDKSYAFYRQGSGVTTIRVES